MPPLDPYRPSGKVSYNGVVLLLLSSLVCGSVIGLLTSPLPLWMSHYTTYMRLFAAGAAGGALVPLVRRAKVRNPLLAGVAGGIAGVVAVTFNRSGELYLEFHRFELLAIWSYTPLDRSLMALGFGAAIGTIFPFKAANRPFCEECSRWYTQGRQWFFSSDSLAPVEQALNTQDWPTLRSLAGDGSEKKNPTLTHFRCEQCTQSILTFQPSPQSSTTSSFVLPKEAAQSLLK